MINALWLPKNSSPPHWFDHMPLNAKNRTEGRLPALAWATLILPPLALLAAVGLGAFIDSLTLGPLGFFFVLILIGPGAWASALVCAIAVIAFLSRGSVWVQIILWILEVALCLFAYALVSSLLGGWS